MQFSSLLGLALALGSSLSAQDRDPAPPTTFSARVATFWADWKKDRQRLHDMVGKSEHVDALVTDVAARVDKLLPGVGWTVGRGSKPGLNELVISTGGDVDRTFLLRYWLRQAPELPGWEIHAGAPPVAFALGLRVGERDFTADEFRVVATADQKLHGIKLQVWHPGFVEMKRSEREHVANLALMHALGENLLDAWVRSIESLRKEPVGDTCDLEAILPNVRKLLVAHDWDPNQTADQMYSVYRVPPERKLEGEPPFPRADLITGSTSHVELAIDYGRSRGKPRDRLAGTGACYAWVAIPTDLFVRGEVGAQRDDVENRLAKELRTARVLGGAHGRVETCIDLLLFDESAAVGELKVQLAGFPWIKSARLCFFAGQRPPVVLLPGTVTKPAAAK